jgi:hypothetical protein
MFSVPHAFPDRNFPTCLAKVTEAVNKHFSSGVETRRQQSPVAGFEGGGGASTERPSAGVLDSAWQEVANVTGLARQEAEQLLLATGNDVRNATQPLSACRVCVPCGLSVSEGTADHQGQPPTLTEESTSILSARQILCLRDDIHACRDAR